MEYVVAVLDLAITGLDSEDQKMGNKPNTVYTFSWASVSHVLSKLLS